MSVRRRTLLVVLPIVALLAVPGAALAAKTKTKVQPGSTWFSAELPSWDDWQISIEAAIDGKLRTPVSISANDRAAHASLNYGVHGRVTKNGTIVAKFPGIGHVNLRFDQAEVNKETDHAEPGCTVPHETLVRKGTFRGRIQLDDDKGFGRLHLGEAPGTIFDFPAETCARHKRGAAKHGATSGAEEEAPAEAAGVLSRSLYADRKLDGGDLAFDAETFPGGPFGEKGGPEFEFIASYFKALHGLSISANVTSPLVKNGFDVTPGSEATITPPGPFSGSATFKLQSPKTASWSGDLGVEIPTLGKVDLTAPGTWATLCEDASCTETAPPGTQLILPGSD